MTSAHTITQQEKFSLANRIMLDQSLSPATRLVGWYITDHINTRRGYAWPPQENIADKLGLTTRTVQRAMKDLSRYFKINRRSGLANEYRPIADNLSGIVTADVTDVMPVTHIQPPTNCRVTPDIFDTQPPTKRTPHPSNHPTNHPSNSALAIARAASSGDDGDGKKLAQLERKLKKESGNQQEREKIAAANRDLIEQIFEDREPGDPVWERASRLCGEYPALDPYLPRQPKEQRT